MVSRPDRWSSSAAGASVAALRAVVCVSARGDKGVAAVLALLVACAARQQRERPRDFGWGLRLGYGHNSTVQILAIFRIFENASICEHAGACTN